MPASDLSDKIKVTGYVTSECGVRHRRIKLPDINDLAASGCDKDGKGEKQRWRATVAAPDETCPGTGAGNTSVFSSLQGRANKAKWTTRETSEK